jgi:hypothetical protein
MTSCLASVDALDKHDRVKASFVCYLEAGHQGHHWDPWRKFAWTDDEAKGRRDREGTR